MLLMFAAFYGLLCPCFLLPEGAYPAFEPYSQQLAFLDIDISDDEDATLQQQAGATARPSIQDLRKIEASLIGC